MSDQNKLSRRAFLHTIAGMGGASVLLAACGTRAATGPAPDTASSPAGNAATASEKVTLRLDAYLPEILVVPLRRIVDTWNTEHPTIQVTYDNMPWNEFWQKKQIQTASNTLPDVWTCVPGFGAYWIHNNLLLPLDSYVQNDPDINIDDFHETVIKYFTIDGQLLGFPRDYAGNLLTYNTDLFDQAGLAYPTADWTFQDVRNAAEQITNTVKSDKGKVWGLASIIPPDWQAHGHYRAWGTTLITEDGKVGINNQSGVDTLQFYADNIKMGITPVPEPGANPNDALESLWISGLSAMYINIGGAKFARYAAATDLKWDIVPFPKGSAGPGGVAIGSAFVISKSTQHPEQAVELVKYLANKANQKAVMVDTQGGIPGRKSSLEGASPLLKKYSEIIASHPPYNAVPGSLELFDIHGKALEQLWLGQKTPEQVVSEVEAAGNQVLQSNQ